MAITLLERKRIQQTLILVLLSVVLVTAGVLWWGFLAPPSASTPETLPPPKRVQVDTSIFADPRLGALNEPRQETEIPSNVGRDNPMLPLP